MKPKAITVVPPEGVAERLEKARLQLRESRAGFCNLALEFVLPLIESGKMAVVNGRLERKEVTNV